VGAIRLERCAEYVRNTRAASSESALHARAAMAATLVAALELSRHGALTLEQDALWQPIRVQRHEGGARDAPPGPTEEDNPALA